LASAFFVKQKRRLSGTAGQQRPPRHSCCRVQFCLKPAKVPDRRRLLFNRGGIMEWREYYDRGWQLIRENKYDEAIEVFSTYLEENPDDSSFLESRASAWSWKGNREAVIADYTRMIAVKPEFPDGWNGRGNQYHEMGEYDRAIADYTEAIARMPQHPSYWSNRGISYYEKGEIDKALEDLNKALDIDSEHSWALMHRGRLWKRTGNMDAAIADFTRALIYAPEDYWTLNQRGYCWFTKGEFDKAIANYSAAIAVKPDDADLWLDRGVCHWNKKSEEETDLAADDFTQAIELDPDNAYAYFCRGCTGNAKAQEQINTIKAIIMGRAKDEAERLMMMAQLERIQGYNKLIPFFNGILVNLRSDLTEMEDLMLKGANMLAPEFLKEAVEDFTRAIALDPDNAEAFYERGRCYALAGDAGKAAADYEQTLALNPSHPKAAEKRNELKEQ
jgi:tetratricopeptide (TPR) repeat protein